MIFTCSAIMVFLLSDFDKRSRTKCTQQYRTCYRRSSKPWSPCESNIAEGTTSLAKDRRSNTLESIAEAESAEKKSRSHFMLPGQARTLMGASYGPCVACSPGLPAVVNKDRPTSCPSRPMWPEIQFFRKELPEACHCPIERKTEYNHHRLLIHSSLHSYYHSRDLQPPLPLLKRTAHGTLDSFLPSTYHGLVLG